ncbi:SDR family NAD(P)-dependent oxidoreductase [Streptomyces sp. NPDC006798]|uniref:SDR family NAD(P)-dependent oxidoreductase n=1 Tax=Streptomyces sp. NPDC006798 TaxID=3155462 RepID=UPI003407C14B
MKTYVITGGTDGIGRAVARTFLDRGQEVVVIGRDEEKAGPGRRPRGDAARPPGRTSSAPI